MLKNDYKDDVFTGSRKYTMVTNADGTVSLVDATAYTQTGDYLGAADVNLITAEVNEAPIYQTAGGTPTAITLNGINLINGFSKTFIVSANNNSGATTINTRPLYKPGTTTAPTLISGKAVTVWYNSAGNCFFIKASAEGTAVVADVLASKTFSNDSDTGLTGTMPNNGSVGTNNLTTEGAEYTIPLGYHNGLGKVKAVITGLIASVVKAGTTAGGILGTFTADATATAAQMLSGATAYVNGVKITGNIASKTAQTYTPGTANQVIGANQYLSGSQTILGDPDLIPANVLNTANIFGVQGVAITGKRTASGTVLASAFGQTFYCVNGNPLSSGYVTVSGLTFLPSIILLTWSDGTDNHITVYDTISSMYPKTAKITTFNAFSKYDVFSANFKGDASPAYVSSTGFCLPVYQTNLTYNWIAYE